MPQDMRELKVRKKNIFFSTYIFPVAFKVSGEASEVFVVGSMNKWKQPIPLQRCDDPETGVYFQTTLYLPAGDYEYRYLVDGVEKVRLPLSISLTRPIHFQPPSVTPLQPPALALQPPALTLQPPSVTLQPPALALQPPSVTLQPPSVTLQPPSVTLQTPALTLQPPSVTPQPPSVTPQPPSVTLHPPSVTLRPPSVTLQPPSVTLQTPSLTLQPPSLTPQPPSVTPQPPSVTLHPPWVALPRPLPAPVPLSLPLPPDVEVSDHNKMASKFSEGMCNVYKVVPSSIAHSDDEAQETILHIRWHRSTEPNRFDLIHDENKLQYLPTTEDVGCCLQVRRPEGAPLPPPPPRPHRPRPPAAPPAPRTLTARVCVGVRWEGPSDGDATASPERLPAGVPNQHQVQATHLCFRLLLRMCVSVGGGPTDGQLMAN